MSEAIAGGDEERCGRGHRDALAQLAGEERRRERRRDEQDAAAEGRDVVHGG